MSGCVVYNIRRS